MYSSANKIIQSLFIMIALVAYYMYYSTINSYYTETNNIIENNGPYYYP